MSFLGILRSGTLMRGALVASLIVLNTSAFGGVCEDLLVGTHHKTISQTQNGIEKIILVDDSNSSWGSIIEETEILANYRNWVRGQVTPEQHVLDSRLRQAVEALEDEGYKAGLLPVIDLFLQNEIGQVMLASRLELTLLEEHLKTQGIKSGTEFYSLVLERKSSERTELKVYFSSQNEIGQCGRPDGWYSLIVADLREGWKLKAYLHNHPFMEDGGWNGKTGGNLVPSAGDVLEAEDLAKRFHLEELRITNGFETLRISASEFFRIYP